jgi:hypothetical protein
MEANEHPGRMNCRFCAESIPATARICPRCRQWLSFRSFRHPVVSTLFIALMILIALAILFRVVDHVQRLMNPPPYYSDFRNSIQILKSNMEWVDTTDGPRLFVMGIVTNQSQFAWRSPEFECRFFNSSGQMIDAANGSSYFTVLPGADSAFRVSVKPLRSSNDYSSFRIAISSARNVRSPF